MNNQQGNYVEPKVTVLYFDNYCICRASGYEGMEGDFFDGNPFEE